MAANTDRKKKAENPNKDYRGRRNIFGQVKDKQTNITTERNDKTGKTTTRDRKSTRLNSSHVSESRMPSSA